jgi:Arc/MetJ-type ribon-helix-helix transcriptional regulator
MVRMQVQLTEEQVAALREMASRERVSVSHLVREAVDLLLRERCGPSREELVKRSLEAVGLFRSGTGDLSARHDDYFADQGLE